MGKLVKFFHFVRFACFVCDYNLCRSCVQRRMDRPESAGKLGRRPASAVQEPDLLQVREPSIRRLRLEYSDVR